MGDRSGPVVVASAVDAGYLPFVEVVATSIAANAGPGRPVEYHVLYDGPMNWHARRLRGFRRGQLTLHLHPVTNPWRRFGKISGLPPSTLLRLSLEDALPLGIERVIYLDTDLVVERDLAPLFDLPLHGHAIGAALCTVVAAYLRDPKREAFGRYIRDTLELGDAAATYGQSGVMLLDLPALRRTNYQRKMVDVLERLGPQLHYADQCAMNAVVKGDYEVIDPLWNVIASNPAGREPWIAHFAGRKPWQQLGIPNGDRWWKYARRLNTFPLFVWRFIKERSRIELSSLRRRLQRPSSKA